MELLRNNGNGNSGVKGSKAKLKTLKCPEGDLKCKAKLVLDAFFNPLAFLFVSTGETAVKVVEEVKREIDEFVEEAKSEAKEAGKRILVFMVVGTILYFAWKKI